MDVRILSHAADLDGVASAVLANYMLTKLNQTAAVRFTHYDEALTAIVEESNDCTELWVMDLSLRDTSVLEHFLKPSCTQMFDHHPDSQAVIGTFPTDGKIKLHYDCSGTKCTTDLIYEHICDCFEKDDIDPSIPILVSATHSIDLWIRNDDNGQYLSDVIEILGPDRMFALLKEDISRADRSNFTPEMEDALIKCEELRASSIALAWDTNIARAVPLIFNGEEVTLHVHAARCRGFESEVAEKFRYDGNVMVALIPLHEDVLSLRTTEESIAATGVLANTIAHECGGGGHPCAAGAPMPKHVTRTDSLLDYVVSIIKEIYTPV